MVLRIGIFILILILASGCLEVTEIFEDEGSSVLNEQKCNEICTDKHNASNVHEWECDIEGNCICKCRVGI